MADEQNRQQNSGEDRVDAAEQAERITAEATDVRERVRDTFVRAAGERKVELDDLTDLVGQMFRGALDGIDNSAPADPDNVLRQVVDGLRDGLSSAANATRLAFDEARTRGTEFAREDVDSAVRNLRDLEKQFVETVRDTLKRTGRETTEQAKSLIEHSRRAASDLRPAVDSALDSARHHPVQFARESAVASVKAGANAAGLLLQSVSGFLQGAGDVLSGAGRTTDADKSRENKTDK